MRISLLIAALAFSFVIDSLNPAVAEYPEKPIRLIVPFGQGGSSSATARSMIKGIEDHKLLSKPIIASYVPGAAGTIGGRKVKDAKPDGHTIVIWHVAVNGAKVMGNVDFGPEAFEPIAGTDRKCFALIVRATSKFKTLKELLEGAKANPETIIAAVNLGGANHIAAVLAESVMPGAFFRHVQIGGGAKTYPALIGGHAEVNASSTVMGKKKDPKLRMLAYMGTERHRNHPDLPTFKELGYDTQFCMTSWWLAPKGTPQDRINILANAMEKALKTDYARKSAETRGVELGFLRGAALKAALAQETKYMTAIGPRLRGTNKRGRKKK